MATAELAVVTLALTIILALLLTAVSVAVSEVRVHEAARAGARAAARGDENSVVAAAARRSAPGAAIAITRSGPDVSVTVTDRVGVLPALALPRIRVRATSVAEREQT